MVFKYIPMLYQTQIIKSDGPNNLPPKKPRSRGATDGSYPRSAAPRRGPLGVFLPESDPTTGSLDPIPIPWNWYLYIYIYI